MSLRTTKTSVKIKYKFTQS